MTIDKRIKNGEKTTIGRTNVNKEYKILNEKRVEHEKKHTILMEEIRKSRRVFYD